VFWLENFAATKDGVPNAMWQKRPRGQIDKCAEGASLRAAFPEEVGDVPTSDEGPMIYQNGLELLGGGRGKEPSLEPGISGCLDRMRKAVESVPVEPPAEESEVPVDWPTPEPTVEGPEQVPDLLSEVARLGQPPRPQTPRKQVWQCEHQHSFETPEPREGTTLGVCPTCKSVRIRRLT
jgi:hypothetical protein